MAMLADDTITALRANHDVLAEVVGSFTEDDLARESGASEWTVAQVLSHLGSGAEIALATLNSARSGEPREPDANQSVWDRWNAMDPSDQAAGFLSSSDKLVAELEGLDETERHEMQIDLGFLPAPVDVAAFCGMRLNEAALHSWDVRVASDPDAVLTAGEAALLIRQLSGPLHFMLGFTARAEALGSGERVMRVETSNPDLALGLVVGPNTALGDAPPASHDALVTCTADAFVRLLAGRLRPSDAIDVSVDPSGDGVTRDQLTQVFPGY